jgi:hypothetical protein
MSLVHFVKRMYIQLEIWKCSFGFPFPIEGGGCTILRAVAVGKSNRVGWSFENYRKMYMNFLPSWRVRSLFIGIFHLFLFKIMNSLKRMINENITTTIIKLFRFEHILKAFSRISFSFRIFEAFEEFHGKIERKFTSQSFHKTSYVCIVHSKKNLMMCRKHLIKLVKSTTANLILRACFEQ